MDGDADIRAVLREHGVEVPARGQLSARHRAQYERITSGNGTEPGGEPWDGPGAGDGTGLPPDPGSTPGPVTEEARPRQVRGRKPKPGGGGGVLAAIRGGGGKGGKGGAGRRKRPRVPVDQLISRGWEAAARLAGPVSGPVARTLALQAPVAGLVLEDTVRDTVADRVLQPVARMEDRAEKAFALIGPPLIVAAIQRAQLLPEPRRTVQLAVLEPMLTEALTAWVKIAGDKLETARARVEETQEIRQEVAGLFAQIFPREPEAEPDEPGPGSGPVIPGQVM